MRDFVQCRGKESPCENDAVMINLRISRQVNRLITTEL